LPCSIDVEAKSDHLRIVVTGDNTPDTLRHYTAEVPRLCAEHQQSRVLVIVRLDGPEMPMLDVYKGVSTSSDQTAGSNMRIAWVDENPTRSIDTMRLAENIAHSRGIAVRTFRDEPSATQWLISNDGAGSWV
jgi:hypothetical protein